MRAAWFLLGVVSLSAGCALGGGLGGDFEPYAGTGGASSSEGSCVDRAQDGKESDVDCGGGVCSACSVGQKCGGDADCGSGYCAGGTCQLPACTDSAKNGTETDVDCGGGACPGCKDGNACVTPTDCTSKSCVGGKCAAPTCSDHVKNGAETSVDCGGTCKCAEGQACAGDNDCTSGHCGMGVCRPATCKDGVMDSAETGVDCGGACPGCPDLGNCNKGSDCLDGVCAQSKCQPPTCTDGVQNGTESGVDCGAACSGKACSAGGSCVKSADCLSTICSFGVCAASACTDGVQNGTETSVDCGGGCPCDDGSTCASTTDCKSAVCTSGKCQVPTCKDGAKNGGETDIDCGGSCAPCKDGGGCIAGGDCQSLACTMGKCVSSTCMDKIQNGTESDIDCGGMCSPCGPTKQCNQDTDCVGGLCANGVCAPACNDGAKNGTETDMDCGGPLCAECALGKTCAQPSDCSSHACTGGTCVTATCTDKLRDGSESDIDCGGSCGACKNGKTCGFAEDCASGGCNAGVCGPWAKGYGTTTNIPPSLAVQPDGTIVGSQFVAYPGTDFGGGTMSPPNGQPARSLLFALSPTAQYVWSKFTPTATCGAFVHSVRSDGSGNLITSGGVQDGPCDFGGGPLAAESYDAFVNKDSPTGSFSWAQILGPPQVGLNVPAQLAVAPNGDVIATGGFSGSTLTVGAFTLVNPTPGKNEGFVARLAVADGTPLWAHAFGDGNGNVSAVAAAVDSKGNVVLAGSFDSAVDFGPPCAPVSGGYQGYVAKLGSSGTCLWAEEAGSADDVAIAADANGDVVVVGESGNGVTLGGSSLPGPAGIWTVKLHGGDGSYIWAKSVPEITSDPASPGLALDAAGNAYLTGSFPAGTSPTFGGAALVNQGGDDIFIAAYAAADGSHLFSRGIGGPGDEHGADIAISPITGSILVTGIFNGTVDFGSGPIVAPTPDSAFVLSQGPLP